MIACLTLALLIQNPMLTAEEMNQGVLEVSQYMALWLAKSTNESPKGMH